MRTTPVPGLYPRVSKLEEPGGSWSLWVSNASSGNSMHATAARMGLVWRPALRPARSQGQPGMPGGLGLCVVSGEYSSSEARGSS